MNARTVPSSIDVGIETSTAFLHCDEDADEVVVDPERVGDLLELLLRELERVLAEVRLGRRRGHRRGIYSIWKRTCALLGFASRGSVGHATSRSS